MHFQSPATKPRSGLKSAPQTNSKDISSQFGVQSLKSCLKLDGIHIVSVPSVLMSVQVSCELARVMLVTKKFAALQAELRVSKPCCC